MIGAGSLNKRITFQAPAVTQGPAGETSVTSIDKYTVWANVRTETGRELLRNGRTEAELTYSIRCRFKKDVREDWTIEFEGKTLSILKLIPIGDRNDELDILATEVR